MIKFFVEEERESNRRALLEFPFFTEDFDKDVRTAASDFNKTKSKFWTLLFHWIAIIIL